MNLRRADRAALIARLPGPLLAFAAVTSILLAAVVLVFPARPRRRSASRRMHRAVSK
ncbi:MAG: hypothetical protein AAFW01_19070 [Pseudomonadota bacterium]